MKRAATAVLLVLGVAAACGGSSSSGPASGATIRFAHNDWLSANLNDAVAKQLLETELGYKVELVSAGTSDQFPSIANGDLHVSLEVWPAGHTDAIHQYIDTAHTIEYAGTLGPNAKAGWFIPTYLLEEHPELATWDGFKTPANVTLFGTPDTLPRGRFLGGDPSWAEFDDQIIQNLDLDFKVDYAGSEEAELAELQSAYEKREPILMYFWLPHWAIVVYDMTLVALPPYTPECWSKAASHGIDCDYPTDHLFKMIWPGLAAYAPSAYRFLRAMSYPTQAQLDMMSAVKLRGETVEQAASEWISQHPDVWRPWIDAAKNGG